MALGDPPTMFPEISVRVQFCKVNLHFIWLIFLISSLPFQGHIFLGHMFDLVSQDLVCLYQIVDCWNYMVNMALVCGCDQCKFVKRGGYVPGRYHSVHTMISCLAYTQPLGDLDVIVFVRKKLLKSNPHLFVHGSISLHYLQASTWRPDANKMWRVLCIPSTVMYGVLPS